MSKTTTEGASPSDSDPRARSVWTKLAITLLAPLFLLIGEFVTLPGVDEPGLPAEVRRSSVGIFALGVMPFLSAALLVELSALLVPAWRPLRHGGPEGRRKLGRATIVLAFLLMLFQGYAVTQSLSATPSTSRISMPLVLVTLVAGSGVLFLVAEFVTKHGLASGWGAIYTMLPILAVLRILIQPHAEPFSTMDVMVFVACVAATSGLTYYTLERMQRGQLRREEREATYRESAVKSALPTVSIPVPAAGIVPLFVAQTLLMLPATLANTSPTMAAIGHSLAKSDLVYNAATLVVVVVFGVLTAWLFNIPDRIVHLMVRAHEGASPRAVAGEVRARLPRAIVDTLVVLFALVAIRVARQKTQILAPTLEIVLFTALVLDLRAEVRALRVNPDLVAVWPEHRPYAIEAARHALAEAGILMHARGAGLRTMFQFGGPTMPIDLMVPKRNAKQATKILKRLLSPRPNEKPVKDWEIKRIALAAPISILCVLIGLIFGSKFWLQPHESIPIHAAATTLEFVSVDDEHEITRTEIEGNGCGEVKGCSVPIENVSNGPDNNKPSHYVRMVRGANETMDQAAQRLLAWTRTRSLPAGDRVALETLQEFDDEKDTMTTIGWRTLLLHGDAVITAADVRSAGVDPGPKGQSFGVRLELSPSGAARFAEFTGRNLRRRMAIIVGGVVLSAPLITSRIDGGTFTISMGSGSPQQEKADATQLVSLLMGP